MADYIFCDNPAWWTYQDGSNGGYSLNPLTGLTFSLRGFGGALDYSGSFYPPYKFNIAEIAAPYAPYLPEATAGGSVITQLEDSDDFTARTITLSAKRGIFTTISRVCFPGGVSSAALHRLDELGTDIFSARLLNDGAQSLLTTRTNSWRVIVPEVELAPLYVLLDGTAAGHSTPPSTDGSLAVRGVRYGAGGLPINGPMDELAEGLTRGCYAINLSVLRRRIFETTGELLSEFDIYRNGTFNCRVSIARNEAVAERHLLKYRNSLGVFELFAVDGALTAKHEPQAEDDEPIKTYDAVADTYVELPQRVPSRAGYSVELLVLPYRLPALLDLLASDEVYMMDAAAPLRITLEADNLQYTATPTEPIKVKLNLSTTGDDKLVTPTTVDFSEATKPRVFSPEFNTPFN